MYGIATHVECDRMDVDFEVGICKNKRMWRRPAVYRKALRATHFQELGNVSHSHEEIQIVMSPGLSPQQGIHAPPAIEPGFDAGTREQGEQLENS